MNRINRFFQLLKSNHRLGLRIVKTGIAVTACIAASFLLQLHQPFFSVVATVMSMGKSIDFSFRSGKNKIIGLMIGGALGYSFAVMSPANAGLCGVGVILILYLCQLFRLRGAGTLACFLFAAIMFRFSFGVRLLLWNFTYTAVLDSFVGVIIALLVNLVVMPPNYAEEIKKADVLLLRKFREAIEAAGARRPVDTDAVQAELKRLMYNVEMYTGEIRFLRWSDREVSEAAERIPVYRKIFDELRALQVMGLTEEDPKGDLLTVYRYHMKRMTRLYRTAAAEQENPDHDQAI